MVAILLPRGYGGFLPAIDTRVHLDSAALAAVCALMGRIPTVQEYIAQVEVVNKKAADIYRYMNFDQIEEFRAVADTVEV